jgi:hypothetical protein
MSQILLSISDISSQYELPTYKIWNWYRRDSNFPKPVQFINNGKTPLFNEEEVEKFIVTYKRAKK